VIARDAGQNASQNARVLDQFTRQAEPYAELVSARQSLPKADPLVDLIAPHSGLRVLDVGCGTGQFAVTIAPIVAEVVGLDLTPAMLEQAQECADRAGVGNIRWITGDSVALPLADGTFDLVVSRSMFHHAEDPVATLAEMRRVCAADGRIFVSDLSPDPTKGPAFDAIELLRDPSHKHALPLEELRRLGQEEGLSEIALHTGATSLPLKTVLATSFPPEGMLDHVRALLARDAAMGADIFGLKVEMREGALWVTYPTAIVGWKAI
jgi:ubiquinone/menaquinone biosynthesis C-methylase UbiE